LSAVQVSPGPTNGHFKDPQMSQKGLFC